MKSLKNKKWLSLYLAWTIALIGFLMSFYYGEISGAEPCRLCWYQRMALFPLLWILGLGAYRAEEGAVRYALPFVWIGLLLALYQSLESHLPFLQLDALCGEEARCAEASLHLFFGITFPQLSAVGFGVMAWLVWRAR